MNDFVNEIKRDQQVKIKIKDFTDKYCRLRYNYQSKIGYDTLIQNVILKEVTKFMSVIFVDIDIELKMKISRIEYLENNKLI